MTGLASDNGVAWSGRGIGNRPKELIAGAALDGSPAVHRFDVSDRSGEPGGVSPMALTLSFTP